MNNQQSIENKRFDLQLKLQEGSKTIVASGSLLQEAADFLGSLKINVVCPSEEEAQTTFPATIDSATAPEYVGAGLPTSANAEITDPNTGTKIRSLVDGEIHAYGERLAVNADNSLYISRAGRVYDFNTLQFVRDIATSPTQKNSEHFFSTVIPELIYGISAGEVIACNVLTGQVYNSGVSATLLGPYESGASTNEKFVFNQGGSIGVIDFSDLNSPFVVGVATQPSGLDIASISMNGNYVVASSPSGVTIYDDQMNLLRAGPYSGHGCCAIDKQDREVYAVAAGGGTIFVYVLSDSTGNSDYVLPYQNINTASQFSGNAVQRAGYLYGYFNVDFGNADGDTGSGFIGTVELSPNSTKHEIWSSNYFVNHDYDNTAKASASADGSVIIFTTPLVGGSAKDYAVSV